MDPFTEKLLERTRARRENLQKKMSERPNAANRQMAKRTREPLAETNSLTSEPVSDKAPLTPSKPSPSKRICSGGNAQRPSDDENQVPSVPRQVAPALLADPQTEKKPPAGPASLRSSSSLERSDARPAVHSLPQPTKTSRVEPERPAVSSNHPRTREVEMVPVSPAPRSSTDETVEGPAATPTGMRSRLQRLAEQRQYWDSPSDAAPSCAPLSPVRRELDVPPAATPSCAPGTPLGRKGRLANLAATIGSWEDDLGHPAAPRDEAPGQPGTACKPAAVDDKACALDRARPGPLASSRPPPSYSQSAYSPRKTTIKVVPHSPQKADVPAPQPAVQADRELPSLAASPQKSTNHGAAPLSTLQKAGPYSAAVPVNQSPIKSQVPSRGLDLPSSPKKLNPTATPTPSGPSAPQSRERFVAKDFSTPLQQKATTGAPGVKSFLERFGERCQERSNPSSPAPASNPGVTPAVTPNTRLVQERLRAAHAANTTTADLAQRHKLERESELALIRNRFQKSDNMWKNKEELSDTPKSAAAVKQVEDLVQREVATPQPRNDETRSIDATYSTTHYAFPGSGLLDPPPASTSSPLRKADPSGEKPSEDKPAEEAQEEEAAHENEKNVDQSINSAVINDLFDGALEESEEQPSTEDEEEGALNISSMSLLAPLAETVASVVQSPERMMMTSTPASSFLEKSSTPDGKSKLSNFQKAGVMHSGSSDSVETSTDDDLKLPYSIDAYRSIRIKERERPQVKQVIVRKEDVCLGAEEARPSGPVCIKQRIKILTNEMNLQQTVIHQASQALNCCTDEEHGKGSPVEAEAERLLLVATERRVALKAELDHLKGEGPAAQRKGPSKAPRDMGVAASKGSISLHELRLPLKADFVCSTANKPDSASHYFFIMIRAGAENMIATPLASTRNALSGDALTFTTKFTTSDVSNDFEIDIEVYCLVLKRDATSDKRKKTSKSKAITPKRFRAITKSSQTPVMASPGGPNAVRTSHFVLVGSHKLTLSSIEKKKFPLEKIKFQGIERELLSEMFQDKVPFLCPLEGHICLNMQCEVGSGVEGRGFLTMFEDVSGFGAWHRRWCVLSGYCISYWTYPDDEKRKNPNGRINLACCTSRKVEPANREFCARPHTFELITVRPQNDDDRETLVSHCHNNMCVTKNWLSADTKDERNLWMQKLNQILVDLRMWQPDSCFRPA